MWTETRPAHCGVFPLEWLEAHGAWQVVLIPVGAYPLSSNDAARLAGFLEAVSISLERHFSAHSEVFLEFASLHLDASARRLADNGRTWMPRMGLGIYPDQPCPRLPTAADFEDLPPGEKPPRLMNTVVHISGSPEARAHARKECLGSGSVVQFTVKDTGAFLKQSKGALEAKLSHRIYHGFLAYIPLLNRASFASVNEELLNTWLGSADALVRQSQEDESILIAVRGNLESILLRAEQIWKPV